MCELIDLSNHAARKDVAAELITRKLSARRFPQDAIDECIDAAHYWLDQNETLFRSVHFSLLVANDTFYTGPHIA